MSMVSERVAGVSWALSGEAVNRWTHAVGFLFSVPAAWALWNAAEGHDGPAVIAFGVYCLALVMLYAASALSHSFESQPNLRQFFRMLDQICIYCMIAGTFTPFAATFLRTPLGMAQLTAMWLLAACGIVLRIRKRGGFIGGPDVALCRATGGSPIFSLGSLYNAGYLQGFCLVMAGGAFYTGGTFFLLNDHRHPYWHGIWHMAALGGTACHYLFLLDYVAVS